mgnify:CR=1 FL=1
MNLTDIGPQTAPVNRLPGVGPARAGRLAHLLDRESAAETRVFDLLAHRPVGIVDRRRTVTVAGAPDREIAESGFFPLDGLPDGLTDATRRRLNELSGGGTPDPYW